MQLSFIGEPIPLKTRLLLPFEWSHSNQCAFIGQHAAPWHVKFSALQNWFGVICSTLWPKEVTERNRAFLVIIFKGFLKFGAVSNTFFEFLIFI